MFRVVENKLALLCLVGVVERLRSTPAQPTWERSVSAHKNSHSLPEPSASVSTSSCHSGPLDPKRRNACWVLYLLCHGCLDTPSKKMPWVTSYQESVWGSCSYRRVRLEIRWDEAFIKCVWILTKVIVFIFSFLCRYGLRLACISPTCLWPLLLLLPSSYLLHLWHIQAHLCWFVLVL